MKSLKLKLFEFRKDLSAEQIDVVNIVSEHIELCNTYSEKEVYGSLKNSLDMYKFYENVNPLLESIDTELSEQPILYSLKDLYSKVARKQNRFLYETALNALERCIETKDEEVRKLNIINELSLYEWIPEIQLFLHEMASTPQEKINTTSSGSRVEDVYSVVLQLQEGFLTYIDKKWFLMNDDGVNTTLLENHIKDEKELKRLRILEQAVNKAVFTDESISYKIAEGLTVSFNTNTKEITLNGQKSEDTTTLESLFNSPIVPIMGKGFYPILKEALNNLDKFLKIDTCKYVCNIINKNFECYVFNYKNKIAQYRKDFRVGESFYTFDNAMPLIEDVMHELGADLTFFYESTLSDELKARVEIDKEEKQIVEKLTDIEKAILILRNESDLIKENKKLEVTYNSLLTKKHKISEELKTIKNKKALLYK